MPMLEVYRQGRKEREYEVPDRGAVLGREPECDVVLGDAVVSRRHVRLYATGGRWVVEDLETRNGTWVNGLREFRKPLNDGDRIEIGPFIVTFRQDDLELVPGTDPSVKPLRQTGFQTPSRPLVFDPKQQDPESTQRLDPKTMARLREEARALMGPHLLQVGTPNVPHPLRRPENVIGAAPEAHVRIPGTGRDEAALVEVKDAAVRVRKLGWFTTIRLNGRRVSEAALRDGDELQIGEVKLVFVQGAK